MTDSEIMRWLTAVGLLVVGAVLKHLFDRIAAERGWTRDDRRAQDGRIEQVDRQARDSITRVERELKAELSDQGKMLERLQERVSHLPTAEDLAQVSDRMAALGREVSKWTSAQEGTGEMVRMIRDHIMKAERGR